MPIRPRGHQRLATSAMALMATLVALATTAWGIRPTARTESANASIVGTLKLDGYGDQLTFSRSTDGTPTIDLVRADGTVERFRLDSAAPATGLLARLLNARTPGEIAWVAFGLVGQMLFGGRMLVQWIMSERLKRSVVPPIFWWLSLMGSVMLLSYFLWRRDIVGILGQGLPLMIYVRNLMLIYGGGENRGARIKDRG